MIAVTMSPGATTIMPKVTLSLLIAATMPPPAATSTSRNVPRSRRTCVATQARNRRNQALIAPAPRVVAAAFLAVLAWSIPCPRPPHRPVDLPDHDVDLQLRDHNCTVTFLPIAAYQSHAIPADASPWSSDMPF